MEIYKENSFSRAVNNVRKLGAYYTDVGHAKRIGNLFDFETAEEICVLEPSIGDGSAVLSATSGRKNCKVYGVEIQEETYRDHLCQNPAFAGILREDFLRGVKISHGAFSFCFCNPPYGEQKDEYGGKRLESLFLEKISQYLCNGAYLALIIPHAVYSEEKFFRQVLNRYEICSYYKFDDGEYAKYHQIVAILRKKRSGLNGYLREKFVAEYEKALDLEQYPYLPSDGDVMMEKYEIPASYDSNLEYFTTKEFRPEEAVKKLEKSALFGVIGDSLFQKNYRGCDLEKPIVPVSNDMAYLLAVIGGGQGFAGNEEEGTLHLQRGVARHEESESVEYDEQGNAKKIESKQYTKICLNIIENDGTITHL